MVEFYLRVAVLCAVQRSKCLLWAYFEELPKWDVGRAIAAKYHLKKQEATYLTFETQTGECLKI